MQEPKKDSKSPLVHEDEGYLVSSTLFPDLQDLVTDTEKIRGEYIDELCRRMMQAARSNSWKVDQAIADAWRASND